jgi:hypothetical protein
MKLSDYKVSSVIAAWVDRFIETDSFKNPTMSLLIEALAYAAQLKLERDALQAQCTRDMAVSMGVGRGDGQLFVYGSYEAIKAVQAIVLERDRLASDFENGVASVLRIRCTRHFKVPQLNANEHSGGECGACIAEERDALARQVESLKRGGGL